MSRVESVFCRSAPWRTFARRIVLPWAMQRTELVGEVLEVGAGSGAMAIGILTAHPDLRMTVTDYDPNMVKAAARRLAHLAGRVDVRQADATALPFPDAKFDVVLSFIVLHHTVQWETALAEAARVLKPGGALVGCDLLSSAPARALHRLEGAPHRFMTHAELSDVIDQLPVTGARLSSGRSGLVVRFTGRKLHNTL